MTSVTTRHRGRPAVPFALTSDAVRNHLGLVREGAPHEATELLLKELLLGHAQDAPQVRQGTGWDVEEGVPETLPLFRLGEGGELHDITSRDTRPSRRGHRPHTTY